MMSVSAIGSSQTMPTMRMESAAGPGRDRDGDADDGGVRAAPVQAMPAPGTGQVVNKTV